MFSLRAILRHMGVVVAGAATAAQPAGRLYINYSRMPPAQDLLACDLCLLDPNAKADLHPGQALGHRFLAYLSLVELAKGSPVEAAAKKHGVPFVGTNEAWASRVMDVTSQAWHDFVLEEAATALAKGYDGWFLDTADAASRTAVFTDTAKSRQAVMAMVQELHRRWPDRQIIINRGFELLHGLASAINGVLVESVFQSFDPATRHFRAVSPPDSQWLIARIREAQALKLPVYAVDYVAPADRTLAEETLRRLQALKCVGLITTPALNGQIVAPALIK